MLSGEGWLKEMKDSAGNTWEITLETDNRIKKITNPSAFGSGVTTFTYDSASKIGKVTDSTGRETELTVTNGQLTKFTSPALCISEFTYDANDFLKEWTNPKDHTTSFHYTTDG
jgi:YD repeat-containing protein